MSFSTDMAKLVADQLTRLVTLNRHQLAGQAANLDFWLGQVRNAFEVLDGYAKRFHRLKVAQDKHIAEHHTIEFHFYDPCCTQSAPARPTKVSDAELKDAKVALGNATRRFLVRCYNENFLEESAFRRACSDLALGFDAADLKARRTSGSKASQEQP
jgi:hypothetical protein